MIPGRVVIFVRDVRNITGLSDNGARVLMRKIREELGKKVSQFITVKEFCEYSGIEEETAREFMKR